MSSQTDRENTNLKNTPKKKKQKKSPDQFQRWVCLCNEANKIEQSFFFFDEYKIEQSEMAKRNTKYIV